MATAPTMAPISAPNCLKTFIPPVEVVVVAAVVVAAVVPPNTDATMEATAAVAEAVLATADETSAPTLVLRV